MRLQGFPESVSRSIKKATDSTLALAESQKQLEGASPPDLLLTIFEIEETDVRSGGTKSMISSVSDAYRGSEM